jgi:hypothetical protein
MPNGSTKPTLAPSCTQALRISARRSIFCAKAGGVERGDGMGDADMARS